MRQSRSATVEFEKQTTAPPQPSPPFDTNVQPRMMASVMKPVYTAPPLPATEFSMNAQPSRTMGCALSA